MVKKNEFEICVRGVIFVHNKILICKNKKSGYYFFPGGHVEFGENAEETFSREIKEELNASVRKSSFIGTVENIYIEDRKKHHEINLVFEIKLNKFKKRSAESHIGFTTLDKHRFSREIVLPIALKKAVLKWMRDKKIFWASQIYNKTLL